MNLEDLLDGEITTMGEVLSACGDDFGDTTALVQKGHHPPWALRREAWWEYEADAWPRRVYMRSMPYGLLYPDEPPCGDGEEAIIWQRCARTASGAVAMMVLDLRD